MTEGLREVTGAAVEEDEERVREVEDGEEVIDMGLRAEEPTAHRGMRGFLGEGVVLLLGVIWARKWAWSLLLGI